MKIEVRKSCEDFNSYRAARVKSLFNVESGANFTIDADLPVEDPSWAIGLIVGPSGSGKTSIGGSIWPDVPIHDLHSNWGDDHEPVIDAIHSDAAFDDITAALSAVGLGSVPSWLRPFFVLIPILS